MQFLIATAGKTTAKTNFEHIEAKDKNDTVIEEYLDGITAQLDEEIYWAVYPDNVPEDVARSNFQDYINFRRKID